MLLVLIHLSLFQVSARLEAWHFRAVRGPRVEECTAECDEDIRCRTWIYHMTSRECRLNEVWLVGFLALRCCHTRAR